MLGPSAAGSLPAAERRCRCHGSRSSLRPHAAHSTDGRRHRRLPSGRFHRRRYGSSVPSRMTRICTASWLCIGNTHPGGLVMKLSRAGPARRSACSTVRSAAPAEYLDRVAVFRLVGCFVNHRYFSYLSINSKALWKHPRKHRCRLEVEDRAKDERQAMLQGSVLRKISHRVR